MKKDRPMRDPSLPSATAGPTVISTAMVSIAVIDRLRTSVISIGYRPILGVFLVGHYLCMPYATLFVHALYCSDVLCEWHVRVWVTA